LFLPQSHQKNKERNKEEEEEEMVASAIAILYFLSECSHCLWMSGRRMGMGCFRLKSVCALIVL
jgi:hypothetical protein